MVKASKSTPDDSFTITPINEEDGGSTKGNQNATTGASAAGIRALSMQAMAFWFRAPIKAFFRTRVDYMTIARAVAPHPNPNSPWYTSFSSTTPFLLANAVRHYGWRFIPDQVLPPLIANATIGAVLYTSYLSFLAAFYEPASHAAKRVYPPAPMEATFLAGTAAGAVQSLIAAPLDAIQVRFSTREILDKEYRSIWRYSAEKLKDIGPRGVFAGWSLSLVKDSIGNGLFFVTFETLKSQVFYSFVTTYYGIFKPIITEPVTWFGGLRGGKKERPVIRPHYMLEPAAILVAGVAASVAQQTVQHPLTRVQNVHYQRLEALDHLLMAKGESAASSRARVFGLYYKAYQETWRQCKGMAEEEHVERLAKMKAKQQERVQALDAKQKLPTQTTAEPAPSTAAQPTQPKPVIQSMQSTIEQVPTKLVAEQARTVAAPSQAQPRASLPLQPQEKPPTLHEATQQFKRLAAQELKGHWRKWLYKDFVMSTLRQVPSTAAGLVVFEVLRRKYATDYEVRIKKDGYDILLT